MLAWLCACIALLLSGCDLNPKAGSMLTHINASSIAEHVGGGVIVCDCVAVFDPKLAEKIGKLTSKEYFQQIGTLSKLHKDNMAIWRFEQFSKQDAGNMELDWPRKRCSASIVMLFADYRTKGEHQTIIDKQTRQIRIVFGADKIETLDQLKKAVGASTQVLSPSIDTPSMNLVIAP